MQDAIVAIIVVAAVWVLVVRYTPLSLRRACRTALARSAGRRGWIALESKLAPSLADDAACDSACSKCGGCGPVPRASEPRGSSTPEALKNTIARNPR